MAEYHLTTIYLTLREGQDQLIIDGSLQLFHRLLAAIGAQSQPVTLRDIEKGPSSDHYPTEVQHEND